jgi:hypothetical protein
LGLGERTCVGYERALNGSAPREPRKTFARGEPKAGALTCVT